MLSALEELSGIPQIGSGEVDNVVPLAKEFLFRFGYLSIVTQPDSLLDDETMFAVNKYQKFFGLNVVDFISDETRLSMSTPRCGRSDFINASRGDNRPGRVVQNSGRKWLLCEVPFSLGSPPAGITRIQAMDVLMDAFGIWRQQVPLGFRFREASAGSPAQVLVDWVGAAAVPGLNLVIREIFAYGDPPPVGGGIVSGTVARMLFDANLRWSVSDNSEKFHMLTVALHEVGHILGLEHCGGDSVMNPNIGRGRGRVGLRSIDETTARSIYSGVVCQ